MNYKIKLPNELLEPETLRPSVHNTGAKLIILLDAQIWLIKNKIQYSYHSTIDSEYIEFENEQDLLMFKLKWM